MIVEEDTLQHYGILRRSGRYPWGSGGTQNVRNKTFLDIIEQLKQQGLSDAQIAEGFSTPEHPLSSKNIRAAKSIALNQQKAMKIAQAQRLKDKGWGYSAIGRRMNLNESSVRALLAPGEKVLVSVTVQIITIAGGALSDPGALSLSPTCPLSVCLSSLYVFVHLSCWRGSLGTAARGLCYAPSQAHAVQSIHAKLNHRWNQ